MSDPVVEVEYGFKRGMFSFGRQAGTHCGGQLGSARGFHRDGPRGAGCHSTLENGPRYVSSRSLISAGARHADRILVARYGQQFLALYNSFFG